LSTKSAILERFLKTVEKSAFPPGMQGCSSHYICFSSQFGGIEDFFFPFWQNIRFMYIFPPPPWALVHPIHPSFRIGLIQFDLTSIWQMHSSILKKTSKKKKKNLIYFF